MHPDCNSIVEPQSLWSMLAVNFDQETHTLIIIHEFPNRAPYATISDRLERTTSLVLGKAIAGHLCDFVFEPL
ncbi:hypothetical protein GJ744_003407 [Endocarpon pusillum]|uniref:Uncharacterized protein n=1 Tax=Endocarpon pusillum TaxID=364733 RepID=A0A8H7A9X2_9EURO|nr:hypothetical protein GJ744_003407 [Endocarpon pusillum]